MPDKPSWANTFHRRRFAAALLPRLFVPGHTSRAPPVGFELRTGDCKGPGLRPEIVPWTVTFNGRSTNLIHCVVRYTKKATFIRSYGAILEPRQDENRRVDRPTRQFYRQDRCAVGKAQCTAQNRNVDRIRSYHVCKLFSRSNISDPSNFIREKSPDQLDLAIADWTCAQHAV